MPPMPPLPPEQPQPQQPQQQHHTPLAASQNYPSMISQQQQQVFNGFQWRWNHPQMSASVGSSMGNEMPHISQMLMREADAWRAILSLHNTAVGIARSFSEETDLHFDENREATAQREVSYLSSLSQLASSCDAIVSEAIKIRGLRKAKHQMETECVKELLRGHADEVLALGDSMARNSALTFTAIASEMRTIHQALKTQLNQARALLGAIHDARNISLPNDATVVVGLRYSDGRAELQTTGELLHKLYANGGQMTEESLGAVLAGGVAAPKAANARTFSRRGCELRMQQELLSAPQSTNVVTDVKAA